MNREGNQVTERQVVLGKKKESVCYVGVSH